MLPLLWMDYASQDLFYLNLTHTVYKWYHGPYDPVESPTDTLNV